MQVKDDELYKPAAPQVGHSSKHSDLVLTHLEQLSCEWGMKRPLLVKGEFSMCKDNPVMSPN